MSLRQMNKELVSLRTQVSYKTFEQESELFKEIEAVKARINHTKNLKEIRDKYEYATRRSRKAR